MSNLNPTSEESQVSEPMRYYAASTGWYPVNLREVWRSRGLIWMLALRNIKVRYRQTIVGVAWAVIQPLVTMVVFGVLFHLVRAQPTSGKIPYAVTCLCGLVPWQLFSSTLTQSTASLVSNQHLLTKVYFPRAVLPCAAVVSGLVDFSIAFGVLIAIMIGWGVVPSMDIVYLPALVILVLLTSLAFGIWLSALNALYRDVGHVVPFLVQIGLFVSPVVYEMQAVVPVDWQWLYSLNPMVGVLEGFRWTLLGKSAPPVQSMLFSTVGVSFILLTGLIVFRRLESQFADRI